MPSWWRDETAAPDQHAGNAEVKESSGAWSKVVGQAGCNTHSQAHVQRVLKLLSPAKPRQFNLGAQAVVRRDTRDQASSAGEAAPPQGHANNEQGQLSNTQETDAANNLELLTPAPGKTHWHLPLLSQAHVPTVKGGVPWG